MTKAYKDARKMFYSDINVIAVDGDEAYRKQVRDSLYKICKRHKKKTVMTRQLNNTLYVYLWKIKK